MNKISQTETEIQKEILEYLELSQIKAWRNNTGRRGGVSYGLCAGSSDIIGIFQGRFLAIEVKKKGGIVSDDQRDFIDEVLTAGGVAFAAWSLEEVKSKLWAEKKRIEAKNSNNERLTVAKLATRKG